MEPVALTVDMDDRHVMREAVEYRGGEDLIVRKDLRQVAHMLVRGEEHGPAFVTRRDETEEEIRLYAVQRTEADFADDQQAAIEVAPRPQACGQGRRISLEYVHQIVEHEIREAGAVFDPRNTRGRRQVTFPDPQRPKKEDVGLLAQVRTLNLPRFRRDKCVEKSGRD